MFAGQLALIAAALFSGAALYVGAVEHVARNALPIGARLTEWKPAYKRGAMMQAPLAIFGGALGLIAWWQSADWQWAVGALIILANWPYTLIAIMPVNKKLLAIDPGAAGAEAGAMLEEWARLHAGRTALGFLATLTFLWASLR